MEPMALGSPVGSPAAQSANASIYLPPFLMGDQQTPTTPRSNALSPNKTGRNVSFAQSPVATSPQDYNRSHIGQKTLFGTYQESPISPLVSRNLGAPNHNAGMSGPPTQDLFDTLRNEINAQIQSPLSRNLHQDILGTPTNQSYQNSNLPTVLNQSFQPQQINDSYYGNNSFNTTRNRMPTNLNNSNIYENNYNQLHTSGKRETDFWVTVFGFPTTATTSILQHFSQCGTILDKVFPSQKGNWMHLKFSSRLECDKALNYNEKILSNNIMIGVTYCKDRKVLDKENLLDNGAIATPDSSRPKIRCLNHHSPESTSIKSPTAPHKASGLMNKAMDLFFGW